MMAMFQLLEKLLMLCGPKSGGASQHPDDGASQHPDKAVCQLGPQILVIYTKSEALLDHIAATCCHRCHCLIFTVVSGSSSLPPPPCCWSSSAPMNNFPAIKSPHPPLPSKNPFAIHHCCQILLPALTTLPQPLSTTHPAIAMPSPCHSPFPHPLSTRCLSSPCCPLLTPSNATAHCHH